MNALGQHIDAQRGDQVAAQRGRAPQLIVIAELCIEADDQAGLTQSGPQHIDIIGQIETAAFFTAFDNDFAMGVRNPLFLQGANRGQ